MASTLFVLKEGGKGYFVKRDLPYFLAIFFFVVRREKPVSVFVKRENAIFL